MLQSETAEGSFSFFVPEPNSVNCITQVSLINWNFFLLKPLVGIDCSSKTHIVAKCVRGMIIDHSIFAVTETV